ncbi:MAG: adaptor protein MecA [Lysinibacillus sp.]
MDIERVNENTLKLFITYNDIEDRGYSREEIWYNRAKGEQLFWDMIDEVNTDDYFDVEGPIWIHINASDVGLEIVVTRAHILKDGESLDDHSQFSEHREMFAPFDEVGEELLNHLSQFGDIDESELLADTDIFVYKFKDIDELIPVAKRMTDDTVDSSLFKYENYYYLVVDYGYVDEEVNRYDKNAVIREFLTPSNFTIHRLEEYGELIMENDCFATVRQYFI